MSGYGHSGYGSDIRRGGLGVVSGRRVFGSSSTTSQVHTSRVRLPNGLSPTSNAPYGGAGKLCGSMSNPWGFKDPEAKRKKRIAKYKVYTAEGKVKASLRRGVRWIKNKCSFLVHGC